MTNNRNVTINGLSVNVNGYEARNDNDLADTIVHRINDMLNEDGSVWGKQTCTGSFLESRRNFYCLAIKKTLQIS